jgi:hypothetical protein
MSWERLVVRRVIGTGTKTTMKGLRQAQQVKLDFSEKTGTLVNGYRRLTGSGD